MKRMFPVFPFLIYLQGITSQKYIVEMHFECRDIGPTAVVTICGVSLT